MKKVYVLFFLVSLGIGIGLLFYIPLPGYMDADYYYAGARTLATGGGLNDFYIWNYLNPPTGIPFPSHQYWMPMASIIASITMMITHNSSLITARIPFVFLAALVPPFMVYISFLYTKKQTIALLSGILAVLSGYFLRYLTQTDTFAILMLCGLVLILLLKGVAENPSWKKFISLGFICGVLYLSRAEGILWLVFVIVYIVIILRYQKHTKRIAIKLLSLIFGFTLITGGWFLHNYLTFGSFSPISGLNSLWLTSYNDVFIYKSDIITFNRWLSYGWLNIFVDRLKAGGINLLTFLGIHSMFILIPGLIAGFWKEINQPVSRFFGIVYIFLFGLMSVIFPYAGSRGGFLHSEAVIQPYIWLVAAIGLVNLIERIPPKYQLTPKRLILGIGFLCFIISTFAVITISTNGIAGINQDARKSGEWLMANSRSKYVRVMTNNPPGYFVANHIPTIMIPVNGLDAVETAADQYGVTNLVIREEYLSELNLPNQFWDGSDRFELVHQFTSSIGEQIYILNFRRTESQ